MEGHFDKIPDESKILESASRTHQSWQQGGHEGALQRALKTALEQVLDDVASEKVSALTSELSADAERLIADVRRALETES